METLPYNDDRMYVLEISRVSVSAIDEDGLQTVEIFRPDNKKPPEGQKIVWALVTRRNTWNYPPTRTDEFDTREEAKAYYKKVVVTTPLISLGRRSPTPTPSLEHYTEWLKSQNLFDPLLNPAGEQRKFP